MGGCRRKPHRVTPEERRVYEQVFERDGGACVAPLLDPGVDPCSGPITRQHVRKNPGDPRVTATNRVLLLCWHHHLDGWATSKQAMEKQRRYLGLLVE